LNDLNKQFLEISKSFSIFCCWFYIPWSLDRLYQYSRNGSVAISLMNQFNGEFNAGSTTFTGAALAFHNINGDPFSITYATAGKVLNQTELPP